MDTLHHETASSNFIKNGIPKAGPIVVMSAPQWNVSEAFRAPTGYSCNTTESKLKETKQNQKKTPNNNSNRKTFCGAELCQVLWGSITLKERTSTPSNFMWSAASTLLSLKSMCIQMRFIFFKLHLYAKTQERIMQLTHLCLFPFGGLLYYLNHEEFFALFMHNY